MRVARGVLQNFPGPGRQGHAPGRGIAELGAYTMARSHTGKHKTTSARRRSLTAEQRAALYLWAILWAAERAVNLVGVSLRDPTPARPVNAERPQGSNLVTPGTARRKTDL